MKIFIRLLGIFTILFTIIVLGEKFDFNQMTLLGLQLADLGVMVGNVLIGTTVTTVTWVWLGIFRWTEKTQTNHYFPLGSLLKSIGLGLFAVAYLRLLAPHLSFSLFEIRIPVDLDLQNALFSSR